MFITAQRFSWHRGITLILWAFMGLSCVELSFAQEFESESWGASSIQDQMVEKIVEALIIVPGPGDVKKARRVCLCQCCSGTCQNNDPWIELPTPPPPASGGAPACSSYDGISCGAPPPGSSKLNGCQPHVMFTEATLLH